MEERTPPPWAERVGVFTATVESVGRVVADIEDPQRPGIGEWDVGALARHTLRAVSTLQRYLGEAHPGEPGNPELSAAVDYFGAYLRRRSSDPAAMDRAVAHRASSGDAGTTSDLAMAFESAVDWCRTTLMTSDPGVVLRTPFGTMTLGAYLPTRLFELVVHGLDLARAMGSTIDLPQAALNDAGALLLDIAAVQGRQADVIRALTGRSATVAPLMQ